LILNEPHDQERIRFMLTHLVNWDDAGMIKLRRRFGLAAKTRQVHWRGGIPDAYHFQGDNSIQGKLMGLVNDPHSSRPICSKTS